MNKSCLFLTFLFMISFYNSLCISGNDDNLAEFYGEYIDIFNINGMKAYFLNQTFLDGNQGSNSENCEHNKYLYSIDGIYYISSNIYNDSNINSFDINCEYPSNDPFTCNQWYSHDLGTDLPILSFNVTSQCPLLICNTINITWATNIGNISSLYSGEYKYATNNEYRLNGYHSLSAQSVLYYSVKNMKWGIVNNRDLVDQCSDLDNIIIRERTDPPIFHYDLIPGNNIDIEFDYNNIHGSHIVFGNFQCIGDITITKEPSNTPTSISNIPTKTTLFPTNVTDAPTMKTKTPTLNTYSPTGSTHTPTRITVFPSKTTNIPTQLTDVPTLVTPLPTILTKEPSITPTKSDVQNRLKERETLAPSMLVKHSTSTPSISPTIIQTSTPSVSPTTSPSTLLPSEMPTESPTESPSHSPSNMASISSLELTYGPTKISTLPPSQLPTNTPSIPKISSNITDIDITSNAESETTKKRNNLRIPILIIILSSIGALLCVLISMSYLYKETKPDQDPPGQPMTPVSIVKSPKSKKLSSFSNLNGSSDTLDKKGDIPDGYPDGFADGDGNMTKEINEIKYEYEYKHMKIVSYFIDDRASIRTSMASKTPTQNEGNGHETQ